MKKGKGLKLGVIGAGSMGRHHARIASGLKGAKLFAVADIDQQRAQEIASLYGVNAFSDFREMLPQVEAVSVVTPTATHFEVGMACLEAGRPALIEKPLARTSAEAKQLVDLASEKGLVLSSGFIERFNPAYRALCRLLRKEKLLGVDIKRLSPFPERITDANVIQDMMIHDLDLVLHLLPRDEIESIKAVGEKIQSDKLDRVNATIFMKSGIIIKLEASRIFGSRTRNIAVMTENGTIDADLLNKNVYVRDFKGPVPSAHFTKEADQLTEELSDFIVSIKSASPPQVTGEDGYKALKLAEEVEAACY